MDFSNFEPPRNERYSRRAERVQRRETQEISSLLERFPGARTLGECRHFLAMSSSQFAARIAGGVFIIVAFGGILVVVIRNAPEPVLFALGTVLAIAVAIGFWHIVSTIVAWRRRTFLFDDGLLLLHRGRIQVYRWTDIERIEEVRTTTRYAVTRFDKYDFGRTEFKSRQLTFHFRGGRTLDLSTLARQSLLFAALAPIAERRNIPWVIHDFR